MTDQPAPPLFSLDAVQDLIEKQNGYRQMIATLLKILGFTPDTPVQVENGQAMIPVDASNVVHLPEMEWLIIRRLIGG